MAAAIKRVAQGGVVIDPTLIEMLFASASGRARSPLAQLSPREHDVLAELLQGKSNAEIAESHAVTQGEIEHQITSIVARCGLVDADDVAQRVKAALVAFIAR